jgi:SprT protein
MLSVFEVQHELSKYWKLLKQHFPRISIPEPKVRLVDLGKVGGRAYFAQNVVELNIHFLQTAEKEMIEQTLPHELAHLATFDLFPRSKQAHGPEFRHVLGAISHNTDTYHKMNVEDIKGLSKQIKTKTRYLYRCGCPDKKHAITPVTHNRIKKGAVHLQCRNCRQPIVFLKDVIRSATKKA